MDLGIEGKGALVCGSSSGLGRAVAQHLKDAGARVVISSNNPERLERTAIEMGGVIAIAADVTAVDGAASLAAMASKALRGIDIMVLNGPGPRPGTTDEFSVADYEKALADGLLPSLALVEGAVPGMKSAGWGRILAITSVSVRQPIANLALSTTVRSGLTGFLRTLAVDVARYGVTVNTLEPGLHATNRVEQVYGESLPGAVADIPTRTLGDPDDFGAIAAFMCSSFAKYITGRCIQVDGGLARG